MGQPNKARAQAGSRSTRIDEVAKVFERRYLEYQYRFVEFFIEHLSDVSRPFKGDMQAVLVLAVLGQVRLKAALDARAEGSELEALPPERTSISASRISDITGIPRQTVRRKLDGLEERGWILRNADGSCRLASTKGQSAAKRDLADTDRRALVRVAQLFANLESIVKTGADGPS